MSSKNLQAWGIAITSALGSFLFGLDIGYIAPILECKSFKRDVGHLDNWDHADTKIDPSLVGFIVSVFSAGCIVMSFPAISGHFLNKYGRRGSICIGSVFFLLGCAIQAEAYSISMILIGRFATGLSIGLLSNAVTMYQGEIAPASMRGSLMSLYQLMITFGILCACFLDKLLVEHENGWRWAIAVQAIPATLLLIGMYFLPASPRWLVTQGRNDEALQNLRMMRDDAEAEAEFEEILADHKAAEEGKPLDWKTLFEGRIFQLLCIGVSLQVLQQLVGVNAFMYFGPRIFGDLGLDENKFQTIMAAVNFISTFPALYLADHCGRRSLMVWSAAGCMISCIGMGIIGQWIGSESSQSMSLTIAALIGFFIVNFAYGWGPIVWVYCGEMFPLKYRAWCMGMTTVSNWVGNWTVAQFTPMLLETLGFGTFFIFGAFSLLALMLSLWLPETKGLVLERVFQVFDEKLGATKEDKTAKYGAIPERP